MALDGDFYINLAVVVSIAIMFGAFIYQTQRKNRRSLAFTIGLTIAIVAQLIYLIGIVADAIPPTLLVLKHFRDFIFGIFYFCVYLHFEGLSRERVSIVFSSIFVSILAAFGGFTIALAAAPTEPILILLTQRTANFIGLAIFIYCSVVSVMIARVVKEWESVVETVMTFIILFAHVVYVLGDNELLGFLDGLGGYELIADILSTVGVFGFIIVYLINIDYLYRIPIPIYQIMIYNQSGLPVYNRQVYIKGFERPEINEVLFPAAITAISSFMSETLGQETDLKHIDATSRHVFIKSKNQISIAIIAERGTMYLNNSMNTLTEIIPDKLREGMNEQRSEFEEFQEPLDNYVRKAFPYLTIMDQSNLQVPVENTS